MKFRSKIRNFGGIVLFSIIGLFFFAGCSAFEIRDLSHELSEVQDKVASVTAAVGKETYDFDKTLNLLKALQSGNQASIPFNPFALPIGIGLTGIITLLEALRRKEKGGRKHAEQQLKNGNGNNGK